VPKRSSSNPPAPRPRRRGPTTGAGRRRALCRASSCRCPRARRTLACEGPVPPDRRRGRSRCQDRPRPRCPTPFPSRTAVYGQRTRLGQELRLFALLRCGADRRVTRPGPPSPLRAPNALEPA
jgi:hypothetical protein